MIDSPCNDVCTTDPESGLCVGCGRTLEEITNWTIYSIEEKQKILIDLKSRNWNHQKKDLQQHQLIG